jgi:SAM-dependent methyltransferase
MTNDTREDAPREKYEESVFENQEYLEVIYNEKRRPKTDYPAKLAVHIRDKWYGGTGKLLDIGCGRGDNLKAFSEVGFSVAGVDLSPLSIEACRPHPVRVANLEMDKLPYRTASFEYVFSKSVIEHLHNPTLLLKEANRILTPGGTAVIMTPSWIHNRWGPFYLDYTHVTPFTLPSLRDAMNIAGFTNVRVLHFRQLPFLWRYRWMEPVFSALALVPIPYYPMYDINLPLSLNKIIRFSKEVMLLGVGNK